MDCGVDCRADSAGRGLQRNAVGDYVRGRRHYWLATAGLGILRPLGLPPPRTVTQHKLPLMTGAVSVAD